MAAFLSLNHSIKPRGSNQAFLQSKILTKTLLKQAAYIRDYPLHIQELIWLLGIFAHSIYTETSRMDLTDKLLSAVSVYTSLNTCCLATKLFIHV